MLNQVKFTVIDALFDTYTLIIQHGDGVETKLESISKEEVEMWIAKELRSAMRW